MLHKFSTFIITLLLLFTASKADASHLSAAEFTFQHVSGNDYVVSLYVYRDCNGIGVPNNISVMMESINCNVNNTIILNQTSGPTLVTTIPGAQTSCMGGMVQGYEEYVYSDTITFPNQCTDWVFSWSSCCRNAAITNLTNPGAASMYIESTFNNTVVNNSPVYFIDPIFYGSMGANFSVALGGFDPDGDQLVFSLAAPLSNATTTVPFMAGLTTAQPLDILPGTAVSFSGTTGQFDCVLNTGSQIVVFDVIVEEWRAGQKIGEHRRSLQILPINVGSGNMLPPPAISNASGGTIINANTLEYASSTQPFSFSMSFADQDAGDAITYNSAYSSLETAFPNAQITSSNPNGNTNELELNITLPTPSATIFSIVIEENNLLQQSFSYELRGATTTGVNTIEEQAAVRVYPNPMGQTTIFEVLSKDYKKLHLSIFDMAGQLVHSQTQEGGKQQLQFDRKNLPAGVYTFKLEGDTQIVNAGLLQLK
ncbi:T9SS type A sorting domain-containing protein [Aureispira anguillae]|uniref:T9SS type A sorting domain-containing protein n=1 Tax=Aureispira anguillae TaxID=2864201 RepID=A0A916DWF9_9BACT|nr:T9SS type A sorting domain-containing protein [Aureispira anguillae]BDS14757.1 T9SS type A sorting domain-containing protein [Aureispira anguillae]